VGGGMKGERLLSLVVDLGFFSCRGLILAYF
jgi:hypothetical protein